ncbi:MAG: 16S rRNA (adenine(1518)-N(6)/adenine(1519)-N(6))-dimethyltransferase RsmA [Candidatus Kaiserbacteria bacterium]|nr:16S rRNA (adenine(1518)-N(6)/adenine(1519)-N(6))-dimethyltransferase RsmA [Candidatus Kaiserbacteria bacterium]
MTSFSKAKKSLGQNFLMHPRIAERIALVAHLAPDATVFEIGPGTGKLTRELLKLARKVIALEADQELFEKLQTEFAPEIAEGRLELMHGDIRTFDIATLPKAYALVANIPYYLTGEIFRMFLEADNQPSSMTLLVQKEVAERIVGNSERSRRTSVKKESILSLSVKAYGTPKREFVVPRGAFVPAPKVDSAVLTIRGISRKHFSSRAEEQQFFALVRAGFAHKRKFVRSNLAEAGLSGESLPEKARAEDLPLSAWLALVQESLATGQ